MPGNSIFHCSNTSEAGIAPQTCGTDNTNYYCPVERLCKPCSLCCTHANVYNNSDGWYETSVSGLHNLQLGHAELGFSGSKQYALEHQFILYHGFEHEFGKSY